MNPPQGGGATFGANPAANPAGVEEERLAYRAAVACAALVAVVAVTAPALAASRTYHVLPGDSLWSISETTHVPVSTLERLNGLSDASVLQVGESIVIAPDVRSSARARAISNSVVIRRATVSHRTSRIATTTPEKNAMWVATHTGEAPPPPAAFDLRWAERIVAFDASITHTAMRFLGVPYVWGGTSFNGVDCSGFVQTVFQRNGITLPRTADGQFEVGKPVAMAELEPGDLVFFETYAAGASHVGIFLGGGRFIHASSSDGVRVDALAEDYYANRYIGARRLIR